MSTTPQIVGYSLAGAAFVLLSLLLVVGFRSRPQAWTLVGATVTSSLWGFGLAIESTHAGLDPFHLFLLEFFYDGAWLLFLAATMSGAVDDSRLWLSRYAGALLSLGIIIFGVALELGFAPVGQLEGSGDLLVSGSLITSLCALVMIEQIYRNARESHRAGLKYLCAGIGGAFAYDLVMYSNATITGAIDGVAWSARGFVVALCAPLIAVAARRASSWTVGIFVSRQIVFYGATLIAAGGYLTLIAFVGYYISAFGSDWASVLKLIFFAAAGLAMGFVLVSGSVRARIRVFISKHFYENKYDYREEWLRLIRTLTDQEDELPLRKRGIKALAEILDSHAGLLYMEGGAANDFRCLASWNTPVGDKEIGASVSIVAFMKRTGWVVERAEYERHSAAYEGLTLNDLPIDPGLSAYIVPLLNGGELLGFVCLSESKSSVPLNFEDRDLLKTAGQQIASYLAQDVFIEELTEVRQFEAYNKLTAYIMHDLKNLIAQQSLVVENAEKHKGNPEFIDDAIETIKGGVARTRRVIETLQQDHTAHPAEKVELGKIVMQAVSDCSDRHPVPRAIVGEHQVWVRAIKERLQMAVYHAIRNAQDATPADGTVRVEIQPDGQECAVKVVDSGEGMDEGFIRERLFRPFDSTKGTSGMGIGAYQIRETILAAGGALDIESHPGTGTTLSMRLKIAS